jgi:hypothetical protein
MNTRPIPERTQRDWVEDFSHENGEYINTCFHCDEGFWGHKRRIVCKRCAHPDGIPMTKTAPTDLAGAIGVLEEWMGEYFANCPGCEGCSFEGDQSCISGSEQKLYNALTLIIDAVRGYEAMMDEWERHGWTIGPSGFGPDGKRAWWRVGYTAFADRADMSLHDVDNDSVVGADSLLEAVRLAAFRAVAKEGDE